MPLGCLFSNNLKTLEIPHQHSIFKGVLSCYRLALGHFPTEQNQLGVGDSLLASCAYCFKAAHESFVSYVFNVILANGKWAKVYRQGCICFPQVRVTSMFKNTGVVEESVFFSLDSLLLPANYQPSTGHVVNLVMMESMQSLYSWRALCMAPWDSRCQQPESLG